MVTSKKGIDLIQRYEGCRLIAYKCPAGIWTIGWGTTSADSKYTGLTVAKGLRITQSQADTMLKQSLLKYEKLVMKYDSKYHWSQNEFDSLVSFAYNIGSIDQLTDNGKRSKTVIAEKIVDYNKANGTVLAGLKARRKEEQELFTVGSKSNTTTTVKKKTVNTIVKEVIAGKWGNGIDRKNKLTEAGYDYEKVQSKVNELLSKE